MARPRPGRWTLSADPGSAPVKRFRRADLLAPVRIRARVSGRGATRRLRYAVGRGARAKVTFFERSRAGVRRLATTRGGRGSVRFRPAPATSPRRRIVAVVERFGLPEEQRAVARFRARSARPTRPTRPRRVVVRRRGSQVVIRFTRSRGAELQEVRVRVSDGRTLLFLPRRAGRIRVGGISRRDRVTVSVRGVDSTGRPGPVRRARLRR